MVKYEFICFKEGKCVFSWFCYIFFLNFVMYVLVENHFPVAEKRCVDVESTDIMHFAHKHSLEFYKEFIKFLKISKFKNLDFISSLEWTILSSISVDHPACHRVRKFLSKAQSKDGIIIHVRGT